tara:strand:+ start:316 stop:432 length:117 start_codon:yes stop_codon:yes gene_type:complete
MGLVNPTITHGEVVLLVGGNSGHEGKMSSTLPLYYKSW